MWALRNFVLMTVLGLMGTSTTSHAQEETVQQHLRFYGHFSPTMLYVNDGVSGKAYVADNSNSGGRIGVWYEGPFGNHTLKGNLEFSLGVRPSASINQIYTPPLFDWQAQSIRKAEAIIETERWGKFSVGQGSMGSDGVTESDLSGTGLANYVGIRDVAGGFFFRTASGTLSSVSIKDAFPTFDGGRSVRVRWDSPEIKFGILGSLKFVGSVGQEEIEKNVTFNDALQDMGLFYRNSVGQFAMAGSAGVSIAEVQGAGQSPQFAGSFSLLHHPTGVNATFAGGHRDNGGAYGYLKLGIRRDFFGIGESAFSLDVYEAQDAIASGSRSVSFGLGLVQNVERMNLDFFLGYRKHKYSGTGVVDHRDVDSVMFGVRWVFRRLEKHRSIFEGLWQT
ncbi:hypothetical protein SAMN05444000_103176 [Shimia gijangensis]|uniref:Porin n=1 Tax=Shimia gijangensis TaxID=1470563 RepID=A0A1M6ED15_9RHOB|nr:hypothetical protein [Shimia gijangensis]SHI83279.1 hypothetical protein SAMN05444000_103176 [Shimia gijangensis]